MVLSLLRTFGIGTVSWLPKVFNQFAPSYLSSSVIQCYHCVELEKKRKYDERVREIERGTFSLLAFSSFGGKGHCCFQINHNYDFRKEVNHIVEYYVGCDTSYVSLC